MKILDEIEKKLKVIAIKCEDDSILDNFTDAVYHGVNPEWTAKEKQQFLDEQYAYLEQALEVEQALYNLYEAEIASKYDKCEELPF